ncbi:protein of unknown function [Actinopolyspora mzabensis]|uniref:DUF397 domain-containing protein n=1 Tax=Actinopolyspora mzabensis TaxID=995066 RepID=A0A1G9C0W4_ACTMZ|nr:DUF397 domain-containing protein [Actinopolyspora mzabensis]SDK45320.1 protein of unknown function [Actinopolyspora mzabensis]
MSNAPRTGLPGRQWRKSSYSTGTGNCLEIASSPEGFRLVRDTKDRERGPLALDTGSWRAFIDTVRTGRLDR